MSLGQDVRFALRSLRKSPVFTAVAVLSLALGIGANTAIFSILDQTLMRALPVANAGELALVHRKGGNSGRVLGDNRFSYPIYRDFRDRNQVFSGLIAWYQDGVALSSGGQSEVVSAVLVSGNYFQVLGAGAFLGRTFTADDDRTPGAHPVVMLGYGFWKRRFAGDPEILNRKIALNGRPMTVVGVTAPAFTGTDATEAPDLFVPLMMKAQMTPTWDDMENRRSLWLNVMGRLKPGVSRSQAEAALNTILRPIAEMEYRDTMPVHNDYNRKRFLAQRILLVPGAKGNQDTPEEVKTALAALMAMVGVVLLIACANVANLMLARAAAREREVAVRLALGARRGHIARQLLVESLLLAAAGGIAGLIVGVWATSTILGLIPSDYGAFALTAEPNPRMLLFTLGVSVLTGLMFGLAPAWKASRPDVAASLKDQAGGISAAGRHVRLRKTLVTAQVALSLVLLAAAGLFARTLYNLKGVDPGFRTENLITFAVDPSLSGYLGPRATAFYERLQGTLAAVPGVWLSRCPTRPCSAATAACAP
jgi:predicted permease